MSDTVIKFENISKQYILGRIGTGTLSHDLNRWWTVNVRRKEDPYLKIGQINDRSASATNDKVWALRDINLEVKQGEVLGIIGKNGAGKSTLLKLLSRVTSPTTGSIRAKGRLASLLEVGTGFHPEMTGRENIYMNGCIMGMTKAEITRKLDEIVDFAGVLKYVDTPVKRYSSGMMVRLGFAIAAHLEPEILVVDEVLAVGDAEFQKKAISKMKDVSSGEGRTVLFVSHNMGSVKSLCTTGMVIENGEIAFRGTSDKAVEYYINRYDINSDLKYKFRKEIKDDNKVFTILEADLLDSDNKRKTHFDFNEEIIVRIKYEVNKELIGSLVNIIISKNNFDLCISFDTDSDRESFEKRIPGIYETYLKIPKQRFKPGVYEISPGVGIANKGVIEQLENCLQFEISDSSKDYPYLSHRADRKGIIPLSLKWKTIEIINSQIK